ncbi:hypothetical protein [Streptomyces filipinensis]|nr:hypothetical protein [Streptomyces filipinensis]
MNQLLAVFAATSGENYLRPRRPRSRRALASFDRRFRSGEFRPRRRQWMTVPELCGFLKPPTRSCTASSVVRSGGVVPPVPANLPVCIGQRDLVPLGAVTYPDGREMKRNRSCTRRPCSVTRKKIQIEFVAVGRTGKPKAPG